jgi:6-phosphogluconolactonase
MTQANGKPEDPGALKLFSFREGQLTNLMSVAPNRGYGFGPRHLDFHPSLPLVYVSRERDNKLDVYGRSNGVLDMRPIFVRQTLALQHSFAPGRLHPPRASEWPLRLPRQPRLRHRHD